MKIQLPDFAQADLPNTNSSLPHTKAGFTLVEVMIAVAILGTLSIMTTQSIQQALKSKTKVQNQIDEVSQARDALKVIEKDINLAFHWRDLQSEVRAELKKMGNLADPESQGTSRGLIITRAPEKDNSTQFIGQSDRIDFVTLNHGQLFKGTPEADFAEIGYKVESCQKLDGEKTKCLYRRTDTLVDDDVTQGGKYSVLLRDVEEFKLQYLGEGKQDWVSDWKSTSSDDSTTRGNFPDAVEVNLGVAKGNDKNKKISFQMVVPIRFTNNPTKKKKNSGNEFKPEF